jgi:Zn-dependent protease
MQTGWVSFTAPFGDKTYAGAYQVVGDELHVVGDKGARRARLSQADHVRTRAERLLLDIYAPPGWAPVYSPDPEPTTAGPAAATAPPNNLVGLALLAVFLGAGAALQVLPAPGPLTFVFVLTGWILAVMAHEFGHAYVAHRGGDRTIKAKGYLAFDPRRYGNLQTTLIFPIIALAVGGIGFPGGAVYIRDDLIRSPGWRAATALAGPGATLAVLVVLAVIVAVWSQVAGPGPLFAGLAMLAFLQATALILNLLPIPGLDGFNAVRPFLPTGWSRGLRRFETMAMFVLLAALLFLPGASALLLGAAVDLTGVLGVPREAMAAGWDAFHFWR